MFLSCGIDERFLNACGKDMRFFGTVRLFLDKNWSKVPVHSKKIGLQKAFYELRGSFFSVHISYGKGKYSNQTVFFLQNLPTIKLYPN